MRHIILSDDGHSLAENAYHRLMVVCNFPESYRDQQQGLLIAQLEKDEFQRVGPTDYQPSEIMAAVVKMVENRSAQVYLAGFVGFVFAWLGFRGLKPSLNKASIITSCAANEFKRVEWRPAFDPSGQLRSKAATSDPATLERYFRQYRSVAHICAARVSASEYLEPLHIWDEAPLVIEAFVQSCLLFQRTFEEVAEATTWNLWDVRRYFPESLSSSPPLDMGNELIRWVETGYDAAIREGLIKKLV